MEEEEALSCVLEALCTGSKFGRTISEDYEEVHYGTITLQ